MHGARAMWTKEMRVSGGHSAYPADRIVPVNPADRIVATVIEFFCMDMKSGIWFDGRDIRIAFFDARLDRLSGSYLLHNHIKYGHVLFIQ